MFGHNIGYAPLYDHGWLIQKTEQRIMPPSFQTKRTLSASRQFIRNGLPDEIRKRNVHLLSLRNRLLLDIFWQHYGGPCHNAIHYGARHPWSRGARFRAQSLASSEVFNSSSSCL